MDFLRCLLLLGCLALAGCSRDETPAESARQFFDLCRENKVEEAYHSTSSMFQMEVSPNYFNARVREIEFARVKEIRLGEAAVQGDTATVPGEVEYPDGPSIKITVLMLRQGGKWRMQKTSANYPGAAASDIFRVLERTRDGQLTRASRTFMEPVAAIIPSQDQLEKLVETALLKLDEGIKKDDFTDFVAFVSDRWRFRGREPEEVRFLGSEPLMPRDADLHNHDGRVTKSQLSREYRPFIQAKVDLTPIRGKKMIFSQPPVLNTDGVLEIAGTYDESTFCFVGNDPPIPKRLTFQVNFVLESADWKVFGIAIALK